MAKRRLSQQQQRRISDNLTEKQTRLREEPDADQTRTTGLVVMNSGRRAWVDIGESEPICCQQRANLDVVVAGDRVTIARDAQGNGVIEQCDERKSQLARPGFRGVIKPICANIDQVLLVIAPTPHLDLSLLDRSLCYCEWQGLNATIVLNKIELLSTEDHAALHDLASIYQRMGYDWLMTSTYTGEGMVALQEQCQNHTSVLIGNSGVGKSSLTQALLPDLAIRVQALSQATGLGQHTTSNATLYPLPQGGSLIDAAGIRNLDLSAFVIEQPDRYWRDFRPFLGQCHFHNCTHTHEPECAIIEAVENGDIAQHRYHHYLQVISDTKH